jgi:hypothetical protein
MGEIVITPMADDFANSAPDGMVAVVSANAAAAKRS